MRFGLSDAQIATLREVLGRFPAVHRAVVFGSRAMGNHKEASDIDLALFGPLTASDVSDLKEAFEESYLPFFVDVVAYDLVKNAALREHIDKEGMELGGGDVHDQNGWVKKRLGDFLTLHRGYDLPQNSRRIGKYAIISSSGVSGFHDEAKLAGPGVVTGRYGTIGQVFYSNEAYWPLNTTLYVSDFKGNHQKFIYYLLKNMNLDAYSDKSAVPGINRNHVHKEIIIIPESYNEQEAIAETLSALDDKIQLLQRQNKTLEGLAGLAFRKTFQNPEIQDEQVRLDRFVEVNPFRSLPRGSTAPYLEMSNVRTDVFHPDSWYDREFSSGTKFQNGDTLLARITPCLENGKTCFVNFLGEGVVAWGSTEYIVLSAKPFLNPFFSYALAKNSAFRDFAIGCMSGSSGRQRVEISHLMGFELGKASPSEIEEFNATLEPIVPKLKSNFEQIQTLTKTRDSLLPKLMSGEVRVAA